MVKKVLMMLLGGGLVVGLSLPALAVSEVELHKLTASDAAANDRFGYSVALGGTTALVGALFNDDADSNSGSAYLFDVSNPYNPVEIDKLTASDAAANDRFGISVALGGTTALVGAYQDDGAGTDSGSAYLFDVATGSQLFKLTASDAAAFDYFGFSVALGGTTALVGAYLDDDAGDSSGSAYLYDFSDPCNIIEIKLTASDTAAYDCFGYSMALGGNTALVGAYQDDDAGSSSGSAYLFDVSDPSNPVQIAKLTASDAAASDQFGWSVALSGTTAIVGAYADDDAGSNSGSAYLYDFSDPCNIIETKLTASDAAAWDGFGWSVALGGATALVGAYRNDDAGTDSGSAYLFNVATGSQILKLTASDAAVDDEFGVSVALRGTTALVGAHLDDDAAGSAYLFCVSPVGDINLDCRVDLRDFALMAGNWLVDCLLEPSDPACLAP